MLLHNFRAVDDEPFFDPTVGGAQGGPVGQIARAPTPTMPPTGPAVNMPPPQVPAPPMPPTVHMAPPTMTAQHNMPPVHATTGALQPSGHGMFALPPPITVPGYGPSRTGGHVGNAGYV